MARPQPQLVALLLCDQAFQQAGSSKWCIIGVFDALHAPTLPFTVPLFHAYVALSDFTGDTELELVVRDEEGAVVHALRGKIPPLPMGLFQYTFPFSGVEFKKPGVHTLELLDGKALISLRSFRVQSVEPDPEKENAEAEALDKQHGARLLADAREVWAEHPDAKPIGLIASAEATQTPWFRQAFAGVFGGAPPNAIFVGMLDSPTLLRLMGDQGERFHDALEPPFEHVGHVLTVAIVTRSGFKFAYHVAD